MIRRLFYSLLSLPVFGLPTFAQQEVKVYPNPFDKDLFIVTTPDCRDSVQLQVYNVVGQELLGEAKLEVSKQDTIPYGLALKTGVYFLKYMENKEEVLKKIIYTGDSSLIQIHLVLSDKNLRCTETPFEIFPNPSSDGLFKIRQPNLARSYKIAVHDAAGNFIAQETVENRSSSSYLLDLSAQADGIYLIRIESEKGTEVTRVLVEQEK